MTPARRVKPMDDDGAQAAEYAMLGGVSAAAISACIIIYRDPRVLNNFLTAIIEKLGHAIATWF